MDVFHISDDIYLGTLLYVNISSGSDNAWQLDWMLVETDGLPNIARYVYNTDTHHLSTDSSDDDGKAVDLLQMEVQGTETYYLVVETANKTEAGSDAIHVKAIIHGTKDVYTGYLDNEGESSEFTNNTHTQFNQLFKQLFLKTKDIFEVLKIKWLHQCISFTRLLN